VAPHCLSLWLKASMIRVPIVRATYAGVDQVTMLSQSVAAASRWNGLAAIAAAVGASAHILGGRFLGVRRVFSAAIRSSACGGSGHVSTIIATSGRLRIAKRNLMAPNGIYSVATYPPRRAAPPDEASG
jgi:hypothetical protein